VLKGEKFTVISDCYNANPSSTAAAIDSLKMLAGRKVCILGDMLELGENTNALHAGVGRKAAEAGVDLIIACGELSKNTFEGAKAAGGNAVWFAAKPELIEKLPELLEGGDSILVKASHSCAFEEITKILMEM
jgi:UDP-N-acetylmuramoyl-tripeptide--D-alanyl-D-alanine ligase